MSKMWNADVDSDLLLELMDGIEGACLTEQLKPEKILMHLAAFILARELSFIDHSELTEWEEFMNSFNDLTSHYTEGWIAGLLEATQADSEIAAHARRATFRVIKDKK